MASYLAAQAIWNRETRKDPTNLGIFCGRCDDEPDCVFLLFSWRSREALDRWMATDHDRIAALARADEHYERIEVRVLNAALPPDLQIPKTEPVDV
jgi:heme-degrading monooxygenase HmoA